MFSLSQKKYYVLARAIPLAVVFLFAMAQAAVAADVLVAPSTGSYNVGQTFTAVVRVSPGGSNVNAVEAALKFDPTQLSVVSVSKDGSVFSLWTTEPTFSNSAGTVSFGGGSPTPFSSQSNLANITFKALAAGSTKVSVSNASVLAADGKGTDVFKTGISATYTIAAAALPSPTTPETATTPASKPSASASSSDALIFGDPPRAPEVGSQVFLDPEVWYKVTDGAFTWTLPFDVNVVAVELSTSSDNQPDEHKDAVQNPPVSEFSVTNDTLHDGIQYLSIKYKNQVGWGAVLNRKIMIDTTPPEAFSIQVNPSNSKTGFPTLNFNAVDVTSGIDYYDMTVSGNEPIKVTPDESKLGYLVKDLEDGTYTIKVIAHDKAGNIREASVAVLITAGWTKPVDVPATTSIWDYLTRINLLIGFLLTLIGIQFLYLWYDRKQNRLREERLRRETREIQDQMEKIFSALRDEIYDQVNLITKRKRLSKKEKEAVEGLNQALEVSETLIEKEINDVKSILK